jgi:hypothetical protein
MAIKKIKISRLTLSDNLKGLYTIGVKLIDGVQTSVKVGLEYIQTAYENVLNATQDAITATNNANTKAGLANEATGNANTAASAANEATELANTAAGNANEAAEAANTATSATNEATGNANTAASAANEATELANEAAEAAYTAAENVKQGIDPGYYHYNPIFVASDGENERGVYDGSIEYPYKDLQTAIDAFEASNKWEAIFFVSNGYEQARINTDKNYSFIGIQYPMVEMNDIRIRNSADLTIKATNARLYFKNMHLLFEIPEIEDAYNNCNVVAEDCFIYNAKMHSSLGNISAVFKNCEFSGNYSNHHFDWFNVHAKLSDCYSSGGTHIVAIGENFEYQTNNTYIQAERCVRIAWDIVTTNMAKFTDCIFTDNTVPYTLKIDGAKRLTIHNCISAESYSNKALPVCLTNCTDGSIVNFCYDTKNSIIDVTYAKDHPAIPADQVADKKERRGIGIDSGTISEWLDAIEATLLRKVSNNETGNYVAGIETSIDTTSYSLKVLTADTLGGASSYSYLNMPLAADTAPGIMPKESFIQINANTAAIELLKGVGRISVRLGLAPTQEELGNAWMAIKGSPIPAGATVVNLDQDTPAGHAWTYFETGTDSFLWQDRGTDTVNQATNDSPGIVKGSDTGDGKVFVENDGTMSVIGWDALTNNSEIDTSNLVEWEIGGDSHKQIVLKNGQSVRGEITGDGSDMGMGMDINLPYTNINLLNYTPSRATNVLGVFANGSVGTNVTGAVICVKSGYGKPSSIGGMLKILDTETKGKKCTILFVVEQSGDGMMDDGFGNMVEYTISYTQSGSAVPSDNKMLYSYGYWEVGTFRLPANLDLSVDYSNITGSIDAITITLMSDYLLFGDEKSPIEIRSFGTPTVNGKEMALIHDITSGIIYIDETYIGKQNGTSGFPYRTLEEAVRRLPANLKSVTFFCAGNAASLGADAYIPEHLEFVLFYGQKNTSSVLGVEYLKRPSVGTISTVSNSKKLVLDFYNVTFGLNQSNMSSNAKIRATSCFFYCNKTSAPSYSNGDFMFINSIISHLSYNNSITLWNAASLTAKNCSIEIPITFRSVHGIGASLLIDGGTINSSIYCRDTDVIIKNCEIAPTVTIEGLDLYSFEIRYCKCNGYGQKFIVKNTGNNALVLSENGQYDKENSILGNVTLVDQVYSEAIFDNNGRLYINFEGGTMKEWLDAIDSKLHEIQSELTNMSNSYNYLQGEINNINNRLNSINIW